MKELAKLERILFEAVNVVIGEVVPGSTGWKVSNEIAIPLQTALDETRRQLREALVSMAAQGTLQPGIKHISISGRSGEVEITISLPNDGEYHVTIHENDWCEALRKAIK